VVARIARAAQAAGRSPGEVTLVAVSKMQPWEAVAPVLAAGQTVFGENRVQEAQSRWAHDRGAVTLHLIGPLQTNKVRDAVAHCDVIETVDRPRLAEALAREMKRSGKRPSCLIEVNTGEEPQKAGVLPPEVAGLIEHARKLQLDEKRFEACLTSGKFRNAVQSDQQDGMRAGVNGTPAFFINGISLSGNLPASSFYKIIDEQLEAASPKRPAQ